MMLLLFVGLLLLLIFFGIPVVFSLGISSLIVMFINEGTFLISFDLISQRMFSGVNSFVLLAVPFFMLAGKIMNLSGITTRLFNFADSIVGRIPGGLGHVNVVASIVFAGMSGSAAADAAGLGAIEIRAMREKGFDEKFTIGITAASSTVGPIIPPSIPLIVFGVMAGVSVGNLFIAGVIPGILMAITFMIMVFYYGVKRNYPRSEKYSVKRFLKTLIDAILPLMTPIIILVGIFKGYFTPTEASVVVVVYAMFLGTIVYKELKWREIPKLIFETAKETASLTIIVATASLFGYLLVRLRVPEQLASLITGITTNATIVLILITIILFIVGFFMETVTAIIIFTPLFMPLVTELGVDPLQFGILVVLTLVVGLITPPVGMVLYVMERISSLRFEEVCIAVLPFLIPLGVVILLIIFFPSLSTYLPMLIE